MRSEVKWHGGVGLKGCVWKKMGVPPFFTLTRSPPPRVRQLFVWRSRSLVQALDHAPLHPNSINFTRAAGYICLERADLGIQTGPLDVIGPDIKISCWFSSCIIVAGVACCTFISF